MARWVLALGLGLAAVLARAEGDGFAVQAGQLVRQHDSYLLHADIDYRFTPVVKEALRNGVPITLVVQLKVKRKRRLLWDETVLDERLSYRLRYHALAKLYQVQQGNGGNLHNFATLDAAVRSLGTIRGLTIAPTDRFMLGVTYEGRLRAYLDVEALPLPLRSVAYLNPQWHLDSPWHRWSFAE